jgi:catechol 2,3-dioxygenase-like lactoylglutathione lyase family enzyme
MFSHSYAFAGYPVDDIAAARTFYSGVLGLEVGEADDMLTLHLAGGGKVLLYPKPDHRAASFTVLNLPVDDIVAAVDALTAAGVKVERYEGMQHDARGIVHPSGAGGGPPIAWFKDPAGNVIAVFESGAHPAAKQEHTAASGAGVVSLQLSVYPLRRPHLRPAIEAALHAAAAEEVDVSVGRLSTFIRGEEAAVFAALRAAFSAAGSSGSTVVVATLANGTPDDETVAEIQTGLRDDKAQR